ARASFEAHPDRMARTGGRLRPASRSARPVVACHGSGAPHHGDDVVTWYLALDTATDRGSVAVGRPGVVASEVMVGARRHAAALTPAVEDALQLAGLRLTDLSGIIVADGPGSFTGIRIAFATVQGIVRQCPDLTVSTAS